MPSKNWQLVSLVCAIDLQQINSQPYLLASKQIYQKRKPRPVWHGSKNQITHTCKVTLTRSGRNSGQISLATEINLKTNVVQSGHENLITSTSESKCESSGEIRGILEDMAMPSLRHLFHRSDTEWKKVWPSIPEYARFHEEVLKKQWRQWVQGHAQGHTSASGTQAGTWVQGHAQDDTSGLTPQPGKCVQGHALARCLYDMLSMVDGSQVLAEIMSSQVRIIKHSLRMLNSLRLEVMDEASMVSTSSGGGVFARAIFSPLVFFDNVMLQVVVLPSAAVFVTEWPSRPTCKCLCGCRKRPGRLIQCPRCNRRVGPGCCWVQGTRCCHSCGEPEP